MYLAVFTIRVRFCSNNSDIQVVYIMICIAARARLSVMKSGSFHSLSNYSSPIVTFLPSQDKSQDKNKDVLLWWCPFFSENNEMPYQSKVVKWKEIIEKH